MRLGVLAERNFGLLFLGQATSAFGDRLAPIALAFAVLDLTGSASDLGFVLAAQTLPTLLLVAVAGVWADRLPRQLVMLSSDAIRCGSQGTTAALLLLRAGGVAGGVGGGPAAGGVRGAAPLLGGLQHPPLPAVPRARAVRC